MYLHIPFCKTICSYCDFCKILPSKELESHYIKELKKEIENTYQGEILDTIYIGGGTPSALSLESLEELFSLLDTFPLSPSYEFTFECNVEQITKELLEFLKSHRVNRLSIGVQTFEDRFLTFLNRHHTKEMVKKKIFLAKELGYQNINVDLMYAFPNETIEDLKRDIEEFLSLDVAHISTYSLMLEEHTMLKNQGIKPIDDALDSLMYDTIRTVLKEHGYEHYEVSNFARDGYFSKHNLSYWENKEYYGFGLGASGYIGNIRYTNTRSMNQYLKGKRHMEEEVIDDESNMSYEMILGLRVRKGVSIDLFYQKFHRQIDEVYDIMSLENDKLLERVDGFIRIPSDKIYVSNQILIHFL